MKDYVAPLSSEFVADIKKIIEDGRKSAYSAASSCAVITYWNIGKRIVEEEQTGKSRAEYGTHLIVNLAKEISIAYGHNYSKRNLEFYRQFYLNFNDIEIVNACVHNLSWTHFRRLLSVTFAAKFMAYMPTEIELRAEIERQKQFFIEQHSQNH